MILNFMNFQSCLLDILLSGLENVILFLLKTIHWKKELDLNTGYLYFNFSFPICLDKLITPFFTYKCGYQQIPDMLIIRIK